MGYDDWLDDVWWRIYTDLDYDADEEYTKELFVKYQDELIEIFDKSGDVQEAADLIKDYDQ